MKVMVTGGSGFIGRHVVGRLLRRGDTVHLLVRRPIDRAESPALRVFRGDITDPDSVARAVRGCDRICHIAAYARNWARDARTYTRINVGGTRTILRAARDAGVRRVVLTSSVMTLGPSGPAPIDEMAVRTTPLLTEYERSKLDAEAEAARWAAEGLEVVVVNPTRVFGPGLLTEGNSATIMISMYLRGTWRLVPGSGEQIGNYAYVDDVADGHVAALERGGSGSRYVLGGENLSFNALFDAIARIGGTRRRLLHIPARLAVAVGGFEEARARFLGGYPSISPGWVKTFLADCAYSSARAERDLGYRITPFETALRRTIEWLAHQRGAEPAATAFAADAAFARQAG